MVLQVEDIIKHVKEWAENMIKITESTHYEVFKEYEQVFLNIKQINEKVLIGDFYGEVQKAIITPEEKYCVMIGCGVIIYLLKMPFKPYEYDTLNEQWREWQRNGDIWVEDAVVENNKNLILQLEGGEKAQIDLKVLDKKLRSNLV